VDKNALNETLQLPIFTPQACMIPQMNQIPGQTPVGTLPFVLEETMSNLQASSPVISNLHAPASSSVNLQAPSPINLHSPSRQGGMATPVTWTGPGGEAATTWIQEPGMSQYIALVKETVQLREEVKFWKDIARQQSTYSNQKDEENRKIKSKLEEQEVALLLMKKLYTADVASTARSKLLQIRIIKRLVDEKFEGVLNLQKGSSEASVI